MKILRNVSIALMATALLFGETACSSMTNTGKGALIGGTSGTALGAGIGALIGKGKGAAIGAAVGAAVGTGAGALIGKKMDKQQAELAQQLADQATVEQTTDANGLQAIKVTFEGGILFATGKADLTSQAKADLTKFANNLNSNLNTDVQIFGYTDNTGSYEANQKVSTNRANAVKTYLTNNSVSSSRLTATGVPMSDYVASNDTEAGRAQNRRVEIYIYANETMIQQAEAGTLQ
jgi:outer membrane protein OmpA-like peptidoglycan-associated protein